MKQLRTRVPLFALLAIVPASLFADVTLDWTSPGNNPVGNYYVSPYIGTDRATGKPLVLYCIDFNHEVSPPNAWQANIIPLDYDNVLNLQYGNSGMSQQSLWTNYRIAAWLITQLSLSPVTASGMHMQAVYQYAAWEVFLDSAHTADYTASVNAAGGAAFAAEIAAAFSNAMTAVANGYAASGWSVVTPNPRGLPGSTQEFLTPTPEPSAMILLATILGCIALLHRRKSNRAKNA